MTLFKVLFLVAGLAGVGIGAFLIAYGMARGAAKAGAVGCLLFVISLTQVGTAAVR